MIEEAQLNGLTQRLGAAYAVSRVLAAGGDVAEVSAQALAVIGTEMGWAYCSCWQLQPDGGSMRMVASWQRDGARMQALEAAGRAWELQRGQGWTGQVWQAGKPQMLVDVTYGGEFLLHAEAQAAGVGPGVCCPLLVQGQVVGLLELLAERGAQLNAEDLPLLVSLGEQIGSFLERSATAAALRASEAHFRSLFDANIAGVHCSTLSGKAVSVNDAFVRMFGFASEREALQSSSGELYVDPADRVDLLAQLRLRGRDVNRQLRLRRRDGRMLWVLANTVLLPGRDGAPEFNESTVIDITDVRDLQERLQQNSKLESMGRLASGVAHDFNNLLTVINGYGELALNRLGEPHPARPAVEKIREAGERAAALTRDLLAFGRRQTIEPVAMDLQETVRATTSMVSASLPANVRLEVKADLGLQPICADGGQVGQIVMNLVLNARDAMPEGGRLLLEMSNIEVDETYVRQHVQAQPGAFVRLAVSDTGSGMDAQTVEHAFEPFFTTKPRGKGTGLGLSTVYGLVMQHGGWIELYSEAGRGTTFKVYFPQAGAAKKAAAGAPEEVAEAVRGGGEWVLVADDQPSLRRLMQEVLEDNGYRVWAAGSCTEARQWARSGRGGTPALLITDVVLMDGNGCDLEAELRLPALYTSGYPLQALQAKGMLPAGHPAAAFVQKPFGHQALLEKAHSLLHPTKGAAAGA